MQSGIIAAFWTIQHHRICATHTKQRMTGVNGRFASMMDVRRCTAEGAVRDGWMVHEIVFFVHDRTCAADEQQRIAIVQLSHLVRGQQLASRHMEIGRVGAGFAFRLTMRFRINRGFAEHFGNVFMPAGFVATKVKNCVAVSGNRLPAILVSSQPSRAEQCCADFSRAKTYSFELGCI